MAFRPVAALEQEVQSRCSCYNIVQLRNESQREFHQKERRNGIMEVPTSSHAKSGSSGISVHTQQSKEERVSGDEPKLEKPSTSMSTRGRKAVAVGLVLLQ